MQLTLIKSRSSEVFAGYGGVLSFDNSASVADTKRGSDYIYTEAYNVVLQEGFRQIAELTSDGQNVPLYFTGQFSGRFSCQIYGKKSDLNSANIDSLDNIYKIQSNSPLDGETAEIVFLHDTVCCMTQI